MGHRSQKAGRSSHKRIQIVAREPISAALRAHFAMQNSIFVLFCGFVKDVARNRGGNGRRLLIGLFLLGDGMRGPVGP